MERIEIKTTSDGRKVEVSLGRYLDRATVNVFVAGVLVDSHANVSPMPAAYAAKLPTPGMTHFLGRKVGLNASEAAKVSAILSASQEEINQEPSVKMNQLITQRSILITALRSAQDDRQESSERAWERGNERGAFISIEIATAERSKESARALLAEFDAANPDVLSEIKSRSAEKTARFLATD